MFYCICLPTLWVSCYMVIDIGYFTSGYEYFSRAKCLFITVTLSIIVGLQLLL